jgi:hypothetical protein
MKIIRLIIVFSIIHLFLLVGFFLIGTTLQGGFLAEPDLSEKVQVIVKACDMAVQILAFPVFFVLRNNLASVPDWLEWIMTGLNSILYGTIAMGTIKMLGCKRM